MNTFLKKRVDSVAKMGLREAKEFKSEVVNSLLDNPTKFYIYDIIDKRIAALDAESAAVVYDEEIELNEPIGVEA